MDIACTYCGATDLPSKIPACNRCLTLRGSMTEDEFYQWLLRAEKRKAVLVEKGLRHVITCEEILAHWGQRVD